MLCFLSIYLQRPETRKTTIKPLAEGESKERNTLDINLDKKHNLRHNKPQSYCLELPFVIVTFRTSVDLIQHCWKDRLLKAEESHSNQSDCPCIDQGM